MSLLTIILASLAALEHLYIFYLESIRTTSDTTSRVFNMDKEELARPSVTSLFKNQGIYNALIGACLLYTSNRGKSKTKDEGYEITKTKRDPGYPSWRFSEMAICRRPVSYTHL